MTSFSYKIHMLHAEDKEIGNVGHVNKNKDLEKRLSGVENVYSSIG